MNGYYQHSFLLLGLMALLQITDGSITWLQPAPQYTPDSASSTRTTVKRVFKGSTDVSLDWEYALTNESLDIILFSSTADVVIGYIVGNTATVRNSQNLRQRFQIIIHNAEVTQVSLMILNVTVEEEGVYTCDVGTGDENWQDKIEVEVVEETKLTNVSDSQVECEGSTVSLFCEATGRPQPNITWTRVLDDGSDGEIIQHDTSAVLVLNNIQRNQSGTYRCTAYNGVGSSFNETINVTVDFSPSMYPLSNQTVNEGQNISLSCNVSAIPSASIRWISPSGDVLENSSSTTLLHILKNQSGEYTCEAINRCGNVTESVFITVQYKPENVELQITPANKVCKNDMITLNCSADAVPAVHTYQLFQNDTLLENSSSGEFHRNMSMEGNFMFKCAAINTVGSANSSSNAFVVNVPSKVASLVNVTYEEGESFNVTCMVTGSPAPDVVWVDVKTGNHTSGSVLNFTSVNRTQDGEYRCEATNECGNDSESIFVIVHYPPTNVTTSGNQTVNESDTVTLDCTADSKPPANITWTRLSDASSVPFSFTITGKQDEGFYRCTASNGVGSPVTKDVFIAVENFHPYGTQVMTTLQNNATVVNDTFNVTCTAEANPPAEYMIYRDDISLINITLHPAVLETSVTERVIQARYKCVPFNSFGPGPEKEITVAVHYEPYNVQFMTNISGDTTCTGQVVQLTCTAEANPPADVMLYKNDTIVTEATPGMWYESITTQGVAHYRCQANNSIGSGASNNVTLTFNVASSIVPMDTNHNVTERITRIFYCNATGTPPPSLHWTRIDNGQVTAGKELNLTNINRNDAGAYRCDASNECGNDTATIHIFVHYKPENVTLTTNLTHNKVCIGTVVAFHCTAQANPEASVTLHRDRVVLIEGNPGFWLENLTANGLSSFVCVANNPVGTVISNNINITVNVPSAIEPLDVSHTFTEGDSTTLYCNASGMPSPIASWSKIDGGPVGIRNMVNFTNINKNDAGMYKCEATNECGNASATTSIIVHYKPEDIQLKTNFTDLKTCLGTVVAINCTAQANPAATVVLYHNGMQLSEVSPGFWTETLTVEGEIVFRCVANNTAGTAAENLTLMVNVAPSVVEPPGDLAVEEGDNVTLYCNASGIPEPNITWTNLVSGESTSNKTLFIQNINRSQTGDYKCEATNECGTDSLTSTITVLYQPENVQLMTNVTESLKTCKDVMVNFTCTADGNPTPGYTLYKDNVLVADAQATPGVWILAMSSSGDFQYRCEANNTEGTDKSENVTITVYVGPTFNTPLLDQVAVEGENVSLTCNVSGIPPPSVRWTTAGNEVKDENPLFILNIQRNQAGEYRCHASNECGNITNTLNINVEYASFIPELTNVTLTKGENVTLFCNASGNPEPTVRWTKIDSGETRDEKTWYIEDVNGTDAGEYKCEAFNSVGNASVIIFVIVLYAPENTVLTSNLLGNTVCSGQVVNFTCQARAHPPVVTYQLIRNGTVMLESESGVFVTTVVGEGIYVYLCVSKNSAGTDTSLIIIIIIVYSSPSVDAFPASQEWIVGENKTLTCAVSGKPKPFVSWKKKDGATRNGSIWEFPAVAAAHGGEYTCEASNECDTVQRMMTVTVYVNRCKQECTPGKSCRLLGTIYACLCPSGKKGENCDDDEELREVITTDFKILNEDFNDVYKNFDAPTTKEFIERIKKAFFDLFPNLFKCVVRALRPGSVDVDVELTFNSSVGMTEVETVLDKANSTGQFGAFKISNIGTAGSPPEETEKPEVPTKCSSFYEGENCNKVKPGWLALVIIAGVVVLAFIIAVIAFCMQKKKHNARSISIETAGDRNAENGFRNGNKARTESGPYARENIAYEGEKFHTNGTSPEPAQPMVTFSPPRPEETPGISINDPGATKKAQPGEGTYADLGDFREKPQAPAPGPIVRPPAYEETPYAEITGFLKKTENTEEDTENEEQAKTEDTSPSSSNKNEGVNEDNEMVDEDEFQPMIDERVTNL